MSEKTTGIYRLITIPKFYAAFQDVLGAAKARQGLRDKYFPDTVDKSILEYGCGPGSVFETISDCCSYIGLDWNADHIEAANKLYSAPNVTFLCADASSEPKLPQEQFDYVFAFGLLHHLNDNQAGKFLHTASSHVDKKGCFVAVDPVFHDKQNPIARMMKHLDSGQHIRTAEEYTRLLAAAFGKVDNSLETSRLRIPYSHSISICTQPRNIHCQENL